MPVQQREHPKVFRTACGLLGLDHIGEVGNDDLHVSDTQAMGVDRELSIAARKAGRVEGDVELAVGADQVPHLGCRQRGDVMSERQPVRRRLGPDPRADVGEGLRQRGQILLARVRGESITLVAAIGACCAIAAKAPMMT
jgi:hypothetical protein